MVDPACSTETTSISEALTRLDASVPLLALGQTVFWDEPMKAAVAQAQPERRFVGGVHDTDYFAKLPGSRSRGAFKAVPHNDTTTKGLWSAAGEFSAIFGGETVVSREMFQSLGARLDKLDRVRPGFSDEATEAWGWRGVVAVDDAPVSGEVPVSEVRDVLRKTFEWAIDQTVNAVTEPEKLMASERGDALLDLFDKRAQGREKLVDFYKALLPAMYDFVAGTSLGIEATATTELLKFNRSTYAHPRFDLVDLFLCPETASLARDAYDEAVTGSEIYPLRRFMSGAIPFELVVPGQGRGTIRVAPHAVVVMTPNPLFIDLEKPISSVADLAEAVERKFGPDCTLIGKAVTLIGMLAREFAFVFHEGASSYVPRSRRLHQLLAEKGHPLRLNPILRVRYHAWDALGHCYSWLRLPEPLHKPFGTEELCAPSFAARWKEVAGDQDRVLQALREHKRPIELIEWLREHAGQSWTCLSQEYRHLHDRLSALEGRIGALKSERIALYGVLKERKQARLIAEKAKGDHFRAFIFEKQPSDDHFAERQRLTAEVDHCIHAVAETQQEIRSLLHRQKEMARDAEVLKVHERRRQIELEAEFKRVRIIRSAIAATSGLERAELRPSAWWFPILCPDGGWFKETARTAEAYWEPLT